MGGLFIGYETARALGVRSLFLERVNGVFELRRGFEIKPGEKVLIVEDVLTTGKSTLEVKEFVDKYGKGTVTGVGCITERVKPERKDSLLDELGVPLVSLLEVSAEARDPSDCPGCKDGKPLIKPGSRA